MSEHYEIRFSGSGGQGMMLMGDIFAAAAGMYENKELVLSKSYGPESRGGACRSELITDSGAISYPVLSKPDFVLAMTQTACDKCTFDLRRDGILLVDSEFVKVVPEGEYKTYSLGITELAREVTGKAITANIVAVGIITVLGGFVGEGAVRRAVAERFEGKHLDMNMAAFDAGLEAGRKALGGTGE